MITPHSSAIVAAFFMDGLLQHDQPKLLDAWGNGFYELVYEVTRYAQYCLELADEGGKVCDFPGVYDYEVSTTFGKWFGDIVLTGRVPTPNQCRITLLNEADSFFTQRGTWPSDVLSAALLSVEFKV